MILAQSRFSLKEVYIVRETVRSVIKDWLEHSKKNSVKASTYDRLCISYRLLQKYPISNIPLDWLTPRHIQDYLNSLVSDRYSISTIKKQRDLLSAFLRKAYAEGRIPSPLYLTVEMPSSNKLEEPEGEVEVYSEMEQFKLNRELDKLTDISYGAAILMLECGLRVGEVLALEWDDILWNKRAIKIRKTLVRITGGQTFVQKGAKSKSSNRTIPLSTRALATLNIIRDKFGMDSGFIFRKKPDGNFSENFPITYAAVKYHLKKACENADVEYKGCHIFRHTFATNCYYRGCDVKVLSKLLGHADVSVTYNIYINLYGDALEEMRKVLG